ncbi:MAG: TetR/AcrR family transcriptional regulator [Anaerovoracaceae bacterium]
MRTKRITPEMITEATIKIVAKEGLENFSAKKTATKLDISEGTIYNNFPNKKSVLAGCMYSIDKELDAILQAVPRPQSFKEYTKYLWVAYFDYFMENPNKALFYQQFRTSNYYDEEVSKGQRKSFTFITQFLIENMKYIKIKDPMIFWAHYVSGTLNFVCYYIKTNQIPTREDIQTIMQLMYEGIFSVFSEKISN